MSTTTLAALLAGETSVSDSLSLGRISWETECPVESSEMVKRIDAAIRDASESLVHGRLSVERRSRGARREVPAV